ncbi:hypothetical protein TSL6_09690 [Sulfurovum sp. TSL6]|uniref:hypothetical protein n=1 Tax=Sulfurovum sp. TSL6 TaxID=2826995 RepID=UPI001CC4D433|nr:hypothetical protein [Sulfurovum sp. TSL6]GIU00463.1 hypothetical protein TSL6_09690 [Sulfurovum sp. TSL6]
MKKILLLSFTSLTMLMADFTLEGSKLTPVVTETTPYEQPTSDASTSSEYLEPITLPACDANNPEVQFITSNTDWSTINNSSKRIFCVSPGDYRSLGNINLTASGTSEKRRYIILNNGNDLHPGKLLSTQVANYALTFNGANYWIVDRAAAIENNLISSFLFNATSSYNILNRAFTHEIITSVQLKRDANNNTIQNCRFQNMTHAGRLLDNPTISFKDWSSTVFSIKNTKIINNEIVNSNDGIQTVIPMTPEVTANVEGTIIDNNHIYIDSSIYTDGNGNYTPSGTYAFAENAIDLKIGSLNAQNPIIITNNHMWGYRKSDNSSGSYLSDFGAAVGYHYGIGNIILNNNVIFDSNVGISGGDSLFADYAIYDGEMKNNLLYECGAVDGMTGSYYSLSIAGANNIDMRFNTIVNANGTAYARFWYNSSGTVWTDNNIINSPTNIILEGNSGGTYSPNNNYAIGTTDYVFTTDKFTNSPRAITLINASINN